MCVQVYKCCLACLARHTPPHAHTKLRTPHTHTCEGGWRTQPTLYISCFQRRSASKERGGKNRERAPHVTTSRRLFLSPASHTHTLAPHPTCSPTLSPPPPPSPAPHRASASPPSLSSLLHVSCSRLAASLCSPSGGANMLTLPGMPWPPRHSLCSWHAEVFVLFTFMSGLAPLFVSISTV